MTPDQVFERLLALESGAADSLGIVARDAFLVAKEAESVSELAALTQAVAAEVTTLRAAVRDESAASASLALGTEIQPSGADDTERASKAAAYCASEWEKGFADGDPEGAIERAEERAIAALADVACYEVFDAWNDEQSRAIASLNETALKAQGRWSTRHDKVVCPDCQKLDRKVSGRDGLFDLPKGKRGKPPLHPNCRCFVVAIKALDETQEMSMRNALNTKELVGATGALTLKSIRGNMREADFIASTDAVDSHGEVIDQSSWVLDHYIANPVVLYAHDSRELPIGKATNVSVRSGRLEATIQFASAEANPRAEEVWRLVQEGILRAVSVGFVPTDGRYEVRNGAEVFVWIAPVLKELSVVPVPANHEALARMKSAFAEKNAGRIYEGASNAPLDAEAIGALLVTATKKTTPAASPADTNKGGDADKESTMDIKQLQDKVEAQAKEIGTLTVERDGASQTAAKAEDGLRTLEAKVKTLTTERDAFEAQTKTLATERDAAVARAEKAESKVIEQEVEALVGVKITPAEKGVYLDLRKANPDLFAKMIEQRADLNLSAPITEKKADGDDKGGAVTAEDAMADLLKS